MAIVRQPSVFVPRGSPTDDLARSYRDHIGGPLFFEATVRRITAGDGELLRWLMLAATQVPSRSVDHRVFEARSSADWDQLAADRATSDRRAIFVLDSPHSATGEGLVSCAMPRKCAVADLGCWWIHRPAEGTAEELALFEMVAAWAAERGATTLVAAADDQREQASLVRAGFVHRRTATDGHRPVLTRSTASAHLVD